MTTTELIKLLERMEKGVSGRSREIRIYKRNKRGKFFILMDESEYIEVASTGEGCAGAEISLFITKK